MASSCVSGLPVKEVKRGDVGTKAVDDAHKSEVVASVVVTENRVIVE